MKRTIVRTGILLLLVLLSFYMLSCRAFTQRKSFSESEVTEIKNVLEQIEPESYHIVLPTFEAGDVVGSEVVGTLPLTEVRRIARLHDVEISENANLQVIFQSCAGGGAGSHTESQSGGTDISQRIEQILDGLDESAYIFLYE